MVNGKELSDKQDIANSLNEYFTTIASRLLTYQQSAEISVDLLRQNMRALSSNSFHFRAVSEDDVFNALQTMDTSKATGADNIASKILKIAASLGQGEHQKFRTHAKSAAVSDLVKPGLKSMM